MLLSIPDTDHLLLVSACAVCSPETGVSECYRDITSINQAQNLFNSTNLFQNKGLRVVDVGLHRSTGAVAQMFEQ